MKRTASAGIAYRATGLSCMSGGAGNTEVQSESIGQHAGLPLVRGIPSFYLSHRDQVTEVPQVIQT